MKTQALPNLPLTPYKYQIAQHFGFSNSYYFWKYFFFTTVLPETSFTYEAIKHKRKIPPQLAQEIYRAYGIQELVVL